MITITKVKGTATYQLIEDGEVIAKGDKKKMQRKMNQLMRERGEITSRSQERRIAIQSE